MTARPRGHGGFSLVELLVAATLGLLLTGGMVSVFIANRQSSDLNAAIADMQESARYALDAMASDMRQAGFIGCVGRRDGVPSVHASNPPTTRLTHTFATGAVIGASDTWTPGAPDGFVTAARNAVPGTHAVALQFGDPETRRLSAPMKVGGQSSPAGEIELKNALPGAEEGDVAIIANCERADLFRITKLKDGGRQLEHEASGNDGSGSLSFAYGGPQTLRETTVTLFRANVYYVGYTGQQNVHGDEILALYRQSWPYDDLDDNPPTEIVSGIENLRVAFGIRQPTGNLRYAAPDSAEYDPALIESVRLGLLTSSRERILSEDDERTYVLAGQTIGFGDGEDASNAADGRHRLAFNTTVKIRNRNPR